jgi:hypothetical protein
MRYECNSCSPSHLLYVTCVDPDCRARCSPMPSDSLHAPVVLDASQWWWCAACQRYWYQGGSRQTSHGLCEAAAERMLRDYRAMSAGEGGGRG